MTENANATLNDREVKTLLGEKEVTIALLKKAIIDISGEFQETEKKVTLLEAELSQRKALGEAQDVNA
jgi:hypothetical protein